MSPPASRALLLLALLALPVTGALRAQPLTGLLVRPQPVPVPRAGRARQANGSQRARLHTHVDRLRVRGRCTSEPLPPFALESMIAFDLSINAR